MIRLAPPPATGGGALNWIVAGWKSVNDDGPLVLSADGQLRVDVQHASHPVGEHEARGDVTARLRAPRVEHVRARRIAAVHGARKRQLRLEDIRKGARGSARHVG